MVDVVVHEDVAPGACAGGVAGSPWKNVDVPYTPIGYRPPITRVRGRSYSAYITVTTHGTIVTQAVVEAIPVVPGHVPIAAHHVVDVVAQSRRIRTIFTCAEAELVGGDEVLFCFRDDVSSVYLYIAIAGATYGPFVQLLERPECSGEHKAADRVA